jgi:6-pyruvoyltetrahydropterin/6-carboxytetrahydropterin synthase
MRFSIGRELLEPTAEMLAFCTGISSTLCWRGGKPRPALDAPARACQEAAMIELTQEFGFDAAHYLGQGAPENARMHGHSFYVRVTLRGEPDPATGWLKDLAVVKAALDAIRADLDHHLLNEIEGLAKPTLENLARYIFERAARTLPEVARVEVLRPSYGQRCAYERD